MDFGPDRKMLLGLLQALQARLAIRCGETTDKAEFLRLRDEWLALQRRALTLIRRD